MAEGTAAWWNDRYAGTDLVWSAEPNRFVVDETADLTPGTALDLACGEGRNAVWLAGRGWTVTGVDFSANALAKARALAGSVGVEARWVQADAVAWTPSDVYDLVVVAYLQLPLPQRRTALATAAASVAPGGSLLVVAHDVRNLTEGVGGPGDQGVLYRPEEVVAPGFVDVRRETARRPVGERYALDTVVRLVRPS